MTLLAAPSPTALSRAFAARGIHYGWPVAAVTFLVMLATAGAMGAPGVLISPLQKEFGWTSAEISSALAIRLVLFGSMAPFSAAFMNRFGVQRVTVTALALICAGLLGTMFMTAPWQLALLYGVVVGFGTGLTAMVLGATVATRWFAKRRGLVIGILSSSTATGQLVFLPLLASVTDTIGWRTALSILLVFLFVVAVIALAVLKNLPADVGLKPYGVPDHLNMPVMPPPARFAEMLLSPFGTLKAVSGSGLFWLLFGSFFVCGLSTNGLIQMHFIALCGDYGLPAVTAASTLAMMGVFDLIGTVGSGWLSDRYDSRWLLFWYYGLRGLSLIYLPFTGFTFYGLTLFGVFYGLDWIATVPPTVRLAGDRFGTKANIAFGWIYMGHQLGAAAAAFGAGYVRFRFETYLPFFFFSGLACIATAGAFALYALFPKQGTPARPAQDKPAGHAAQPVRG
jgi:MFS family permease